MNGHDKDFTSNIFIKNKKQIMAFILIFIFFIFSYIVPIEGFNNNMRGALATFLIAATLWMTEAIPLYATSIIIVILEVILISEETLSVNDALAPFFNTIITLFFGGFVLASALHKYDLDNKITKKLLTNIGKTPKNVLIGIMGVTAFLSMWMSNTATTALMVALALPLYSQIPKEDKFRKAIILSIPFAANIGGMATPIGTPPNSIIIESLSTNGFNLTFLDWMIRAMPLMLIMLTFVYLLLYIAFKPETKKLNFEIRDDGKKGFTKKQTFILLIFGITVFFWLTSSFKWNENLFRSSGIIALIPALAFFGSRLLEKEDLANLNWDVLLLMGGGMSLGRAISSTGLDKWIVNLINYENMPIIIIILVFSSLAIIMSTFMSNTSTAALMAPIMIVIGMNLNTSIPIMISIALACSMAMALPVSTPPNAIAYGTDVIDLKDMILYGTIIGLVGIIMLVIIFGLF